MGEQQLLSRNVELVFKAHILLYHSTSGSRVMMKKIDVGEVTPGLGSKKEEKKQVIMKPSASQQVVSSPQQLVRPHRRL